MRGGSREKIKRSETQAVVLCGGLGTRLRASVPDLPKALAPVGGRPFLDYLLGALRDGGIHNIVLCTGYGNAAIRKEYAEGSKQGVKLSYSVEESPQGTGGALRHARRFIHSNPFLLMNGDTLLEMDYRTLIAAHVARNALATLAIAQAPKGGRYGSVELSERGEVLHFVACPENSRDARPEPQMIYGGVCALDQGVFPELPSRAGAVSLEQEIFPQLIGCGVFGEVFPGFFLDIGVPADYERACSEIPARYGHACAHTR